MIYALLILWIAAALVILIEPRNGRIIIYLCIFSLLTSLAYFFLGSPDAAMAEAATRLSASGAWDLPRLADAVSDAVWWVTLVDATLVRYHPRNYEGALAGRSARRRETEQTLEGLRYVRNQLGRSADPAGLIEPGSGGAPGPRWTWRPLPQPDLAGLGLRARKWELSRYRAYQARLARHDITETFTWCAEFLTLAASLAGDAGMRGPGTTASGATASGATGSGTNGHVYDAQRGPAN